MVYKAGKRFYPGAAARKRTSWGYGIRGISPGAHLSEPGYFVVRLPGTLAGAAEDPAGNAGGGQKTFKGRRVLGRAEADPGAYAGV